MLGAERLNFAYPPPGPDLPATEALRDITFHLESGEALAVMGASGSGKSTLCHVLAGLAPRYTGGHISGVAHVAGYDVLAKMPPTGAVGLLFQDAATQLFNSTVEDEVAWGLEALGTPPQHISMQVEEALGRFGLLDVRTRSPWALSGGQQKRLALAAVWAMRPRVLLLDEPLGGLDPQGRTEVLAALRTLSQSGVTLLLTTFRPQTAALAPTVLVLAEGTATSPMPTVEVLRDETHLVETGILYPPHLWPALGAPSTLSTEPAIAVQDIHFAYTDEHAALRGVNFEIPQGQFVAIIGPNGAGKSTLLRHFNGLLRPTCGTIRIRGKDAAGRTIGDLARDVGFLFQRPEQQLFAATVYEEVAFGVRALHLTDVSGRVERALARFELTAFVQTPPSILSYGMQRAVTLAALAALDTPILALDEPAVGLDGRERARLLAWLAERRAAGVTAIIVTHEMELAARADRVVALANGRMVVDGMPDEVLSRVTEATP
ncbi:MAG: ABC transporter ATP-binding protein [Anaerolineae bacterium]|nr:ABC transporter ATP-binding protein [Anaerolineae bacterium]